MNTTKLSLQKSPVVLAQDLNNKNQKRYIGFNSHLDVFPFIDSQKTKNFYEVLLENAPRRPYADIDKHLTNPIDLYKFVETLTRGIKTALKALFNVSTDNILITNSSTDLKFSLHCVLPDFYTSVENIRLLFKTVSAIIEKYDSSYAGMIDPAVYGSNQCFRLLGCSKFGKDNTKRLLTSSFTSMDSLVGYITDSEPIMLRREIQNQVDEETQQRDLNAIEAITNAPRPAQFYKDVLKALSDDRANNFIYWRNICLALGNEKVGLPIAQAFSKRSLKYSSPATASLYNKGKSEKAGALTIATILSYLKIDNPAEFKRLIIDPSNTATDEKECKEMIIEMRKGINDDSDSEEDEELITEDSPETPKKTLNKELQEDKLKRWLSHPEATLSRPVNTPSTTAGQFPDATCNIYESEYMASYPIDKETLIIKAQKGVGKTHALVEYIKTKNPKRILFVAFRRSFSNELMKRLSPEGFVAYKDIDGAISDDHERVIIQVESLHRLKWTHKADLVVFDEIESIRSQLFSPTNRFKTPVLEKYDMLLRSANVLCAMDADISDLTLKHISDTRRRPIHYIENIYKEDQSKFKEFYTTKPDRVISRICDALSNNEKIVIPCNRSVKFMASLKTLIHKAYPNTKIAIYNSETIQNAEVSAELNDVEASWSKYDVVMYSPTISAGVSFDALYFDKCFCFFTNNGQVNSMRQMISRVRHFKTNEYYYCLQSFGGSAKPQTVLEFEEHITSTRFKNDKPGYIMAVEEYDGTRTYPCKNTGYYLWIYNEIENARDKNLFLYNFLREQYHAGIANMKYLEEEETPDITITAENIKEGVIALKQDEWESIANAEVITLEAKKALEAKMNAEVRITAGDILSLKRFNIMTCYDIPAENQLTSKMVEIGGTDEMKKAYHNRKAVGLERSSILQSTDLFPGSRKSTTLKKLWEEEDGNFNSLFIGDHDCITPAEDLAKNYRAVKLVIALELLEIAGFKSLVDTKAYSKTKLIQNFKTNKKLLVSKIDRIGQAFCISKRSIPKIEEWSDATCLKSWLRFLNDRLINQFQIKIKETKNRSGKYAIQGVDLYDIFDIRA